MKKSLRVLIGFAVAGAWLFAPASTSAVPVPALDLLDLSVKANLVVVGRLSVPVDTGTVMLNAGMTTETPGRLMRATLIVERMLKGTVSQPIDVRFVVPQEFIGYGRVVPDSL